MEKFVCMVPLDEFMKLFDKKNPARIISQLPDDAKFGRAMVDYPAWCENPVFSEPVVFLVFETAELMESTDTYHGMDVFYNKIKIEVDEPDTAQQLKQCLDKAEGIYNDVFTCLRMDISDVEASDERICVTNLAIAMFNNMGAA